MFEPNIIITKCSSPAAVTIKTTTIMPTSVRLPPLPALRDFINMYRLSAKSKLSQNYLMDMNLTRKIARMAGNLKNCSVVEVGPGPGGITRAIIEQGCKRLDVVEIDKRFFPALEHLSEASTSAGIQMCIHHGDVLSFDIGQLWTDGDDDDKMAASNDRPSWIEPITDKHIIGNLPFNVSTPLIIRWLRQMANRTGAWSHGRVPLTLTFQREVAERMVAGIDDRQRCRLSIMSQCYAQPTLLFDIPGDCFVPRPLVNVSVVRFEPLEEPIVRIDFNLMEKFNRHMFHYRQKYSINCVKTLYPKKMADEFASEVYRRCNIEPTLPCTKLSIDEIGDMCFVYEEQCRRIPGLYLYDYRNNNKPIEQLVTCDNNVPGVYPFDSNDVPNQGLTLRQFAV